MKTSNQGGILVLSLPLIWGLSLFVFYTWQWGMALYWKEKAKVTAESAVLSSLRLRAEGLGRIAERWKTYGRFFSLTDTNQIEIPVEEEAFVLAEGRRLKRALSGYKGRIKAVVGIVTQANGLPKESVNGVSDHASQLGVESQTERIHLTNGEQPVLEGAWFRRLWTGDEQTTLSVNMKGQTAFSTGFLKWDATHGNGGFPQQWSQAVWNGRVDPYRYPYFEGTLK